MFVICNIIKQHFLTISSHLTTNLCKASFSKHLHYNEAKFEFIKNCCNWLQTWSSLTCTEENGNTDEQKSPAEHPGWKLRKSNETKKPKCWNGVRGGWIWLAADVSVCSSCVLVMSAVAVLLSYRGRALCCRLKQCELLLLWRPLLSFVHALISGSTFCLLWNIADRAQTIRKRSDTEWLQHKHWSRKTSGSATSLHSNIFTYINTWNTNTTAEV